MIQLSAPAKGGYKREFEHMSDARYEAASILGVRPSQIIEVDSPDGGTTYCYATQAEADAHSDGAYAVQYKEVK